MRHEPRRGVQEEGVVMLMPVKASDLPREIRERLDLGHGCTLRCASCGRTFTAWQPAQSHVHDDHGLIEIQIGLLAK